MEYQGLVWGGWGWLRPIKVACRDAIKETYKYFRYISNVPKIQVELPPENK